VEEKGAPVGGHDPYGNLVAVVVALKDRAEAFFNEMISVWPNLLRGPRGRTGAHKVPEVVLEEIICWVTECDFWDLTLHYSLVR
jgi:hypothetical protein